jgi:hypothetical protein
MTLRNITFLFLAVAFLAGCELEETNINPNDPTDVPVTVLLPTAMEETAENQSEEAAVIAGIFSQYFTGVDNRALTVESYLLDEAFNMNPLWQDFYNGPLNILNIIIDKSEADGAAHYAGVAKVLMALNLGTALHAGLSGRGQLQPILRSAGNRIHGSASLAGRSHSGPAGRKHGLAR